MLNMPYFKQDTRYSCGAAALQMTFYFYGKLISEEELTKRLQIDKDRCTEHSQMIKVITDEGLYAYANNESSLEEADGFIKSDIPIIVNFIEPGENSGHYAVVIGIDENNIILNDPWHGEKFKMNKDEFVERWQSENGGHKRWLLAVSTEKFNLGKQYLAS